MIDEARSLRDQDERMHAYHEIDRLWIAEHASVLPISYGRDMLLRRPWVEGVRANPLHRPPRRARDQPVSFRFRAK